MADEGTVDWRRELEASTVAGSEIRTVSGPVRIPALTILHHPDPRRVGEQAPLAAVAAGRRVALSRLEPTFGQPRGGELRPLADARLSRQSWWIGPGEEAGQRQIARAGAGSPQLLCDGTAIDGAATLPHSAIARGVVLLLAERVALLLHLVDPQPTADAPLGFVGESLAMAELRRALRQAAGSSQPVLLRGETGSGKELAARALHDVGPRSEGPWVSVNLAAIPPSLAAAELFGATRGAFTGAEKGRQGYFQAAAGGTLFLDEIGEAPAEVQVLLLRALESHEIQPVGADRSRRVDVRIVAATDMDLEAAVADGRFRAPLLHRLATTTVRLPPLRERRDDIGRLLQHFLRRELADRGLEHRLAPVDGRGRPWLPASLVAELAALPWPGNVRQLRNAARHLVTSQGSADEARFDPQLRQLVGEAASRAGREAAPESSPTAMPSPPAESITEPTAETPAGAPGPWHRRPSQIGRAELQAALRAHGWRLLPAARELGISRTSLYTLLERFDIPLATDLEREQIEQALDQQDGDVKAAARELEVSTQGLRRRLRELDLH